MTKQILSDFHHTDPFILDISQGPQEERPEEEHHQCFIPDASVSQVQGGLRPSNGIFFTPTPEHHNSYVPSFGATPPMFYARCQEESIPYFEPDFEPLLDYNGINSYAPYTTPFPDHPQARMGYPPMSLPPVQIEQMEVVVELRQDQIVGSSTMGTQPYLSHHSSGNYIFDAMLYKNISTTMGGTAGPSGRGYSADTLSTRLKYDLGSYFNEHIFPTLSGFFDATVNKNIRKILKNTNLLNSREKKESKEDEFSQFYCKDVSREYSVFKASFWMVAILILLWGIPDYGAIIAPLVAGYVGGRKAGNEFRAFLAALLPMVIATLLILLFTTSAIPFHSYHHVLVTIYDTIFDIISHLSVYESSNKDPSGALSSITSTSTATFFSMLALALIGGTMERDLRNLKKDLEIYRKEEKGKKKRKGAEAKALDREKGSEAGRNK